MVGVLESDMSEVRLICRLNCPMEPAGISFPGVDNAPQEGPAISEASFLSNNHFICV